jgi:hypothetical protein
MDKYQDGRGRDIHPRIHGLYRALRILLQGFIYTSDPNRLEIRGLNGCWEVSWEDKWRLTSEGVTIGFPACVDPDFIAAFVHYGSIRKGD